jgi:hypothetical protein
MNVILNHVILSEIEGLVQNPLRIKPMDAEINSA